jgi:hypothetical protein
MTATPMSTTPKGVTITAKDADGNERVITEGVQVLYGHVVQAIEWDSWFLSVEDLAQIVGLAQVCGFENYEEVEQYMEKERANEKRRNCRHPKWNVEPVPDPYPGGIAVKKTCPECGAMRYDTR